MNLREQTVHVMHQSLQAAFTGSKVKKGQEDGRDNVVVYDLEGALETITSLVMHAIDSLGLVGLSEIRSNHEIDGNWCLDGLLSNGSSTCASVTISYFCDRNALEISLLWLPEARGAAAGSTMRNAV